MGRFNSIYPFTSENIAGYMKDLDLTGKKVITVTGSTDHILNAILQGATEITTFDINPLTKPYMDLKISALKNLSYEDFINKGYLKDAIVNYIALLGWSPEDNQEVYSMDELIQKFGKHLFDMAEQALLTFKEELIEDYYVNSKYISLKDLIIEMFNEYVEDNNILYFAEVELNDVSSNKNNFRLFLDVLEVFLLDVINYDKENINFNEHRDLLEQVNKKMKNITSKIEQIMGYKNSINLNANLKLLLDSLIINLKGE